MNNSEYQTALSHEFSEKNELDKIIANNLRIQKFLADNDIDQEYVKGLPFKYRNKYLINNLINKDEAERAITFKVDPKIEDNEIGLMLVKPEMELGIENIISYISQLGIEKISVLDKIFPSESDWLETYGYLLDMCPDVINNYIIHRSLGMTPLIFKHRDIHFYRCLADKIGINQVTDDKDKLVDKLFCDEKGPNYRGAIRSSICRPILEKKGFTNLTNYASSFDPVNYFIESGLDPHIPFNGIHVPSDKFEKSKNLYTFIKNDKK